MKKKSATMGGKKRVAEEMLTKDEMELCDDIIRQKFADEQKRMGKSDEYIGGLAFGWIKSPRMKMQVIKGASTKKPQQMRFTDMVNLCEALGLSWVDVGREALKAVKAAGK